MILKLGDTFQQPCHRLSTSLGSPHLLGMVPLLAQASVRGLAFLAQSALSIRAISRTCCVIATAIRSRNPDGHD
jgi:hypothetical protein